jgi:hypothetical protein
MPKKPKKRPKKKAAPPQPIPIYLTDGQKAQAEGDIDKHGNAKFQIMEIGTPNTLTTATVHR